MLFWYSGEEREKSKHTLSYVYHSGVCRALWKIQSGDRSESEKRSSQIFYYYFSTPIFYVGSFYIFVYEKENLTTIALVIVCSSSEQRKIYNDFVHRYMLPCIYRAVAATVFVAIVQHENRIYTSRRVKTSKRNWVIIHNFLCRRIFSEGSSFIYLSNPFHLMIKGTSR